MHPLKQEIFNLLKQYDRLWNKDKTVLNQTLLLHLVEKTDEKIITLQQGGQRTEEGEETYFAYDKKKRQYVDKKRKRKEIFFNQVLSHD